MRSAWQVYADAPDGGQVSGFGLRW